ncbi:MAG: hypothetical protein IGS48_08365 [Oscillatoriales cyanobacterium C42_A2020_001]|nr:hypothetical protein [Leptolyngbyaceae cyanobacterium C42_A2020_001]
MTHSGSTTVAISDRTTAVSQPPQTSGLWDNDCLKLTDHRYIKSTSSGICTSEQFITCAYQMFVLEQVGAKMTAVASGLEVLQVLDQIIPDVIVSDVGRAGMDGYDAGS